MEDKGGTMRLGAYPCAVTRGTRAFAAYGEEVVYERHRHRYEVNNTYRERQTEAGLVIAGTSPARVTRGGAARSSWKLPFAGGGSRVRAWAA